MLIIKFGRTDKMNVNDIKTVTIVGSGTMGNGIAQVLASHNFNVNLVDLKQDLLDKAVAGISKSLDRFVKKEKITDSHLVNLMQFYELINELRNL